METEAIILAILNKCNKEQCVNPERKYTKIIIHRSEHSATLDGSD